MASGIDRSRAVSVFVGLGAAVVIALVGPLYGALVVICATPLVFLTLSRALTGWTIDPAWPWLLTAFGVGWLVLIPVAPYIAVAISNSPDGRTSILTLSAVIGLIPLLGAALLVAVGRYRAGRAA